MFEALFSLSQTQRRLAHQNKREAMRWEAEGNHAFYEACRKEANRLWQDAKWHLQRAQMMRGAR